MDQYKNFDFEKDLNYVVKFYSQNNFDNSFVTNESIITVNSLINIFEDLQRIGLRVQNIFINNKDYYPIRKWDRDYIEPVLDNQYCAKGYMANIFGSRVVVSKLVPEGTIYICSNKQNFPNGIYRMILNLQE